MTPKDKDREYRIDMEVVADAYDSEERATAAVVGSCSLGRAMTTCLTSICKTCFNCKSINKRVDLAAWGY